MVFSTDQVSQFYLVTKVLGESTEKNQEIKDTDDVGTLAYCVKETDNTQYFRYKGVDGIMRSDLLPVLSGVYATFAAAEDASQKYALKQATVKLDSNINGGNPISGQDYILRICINPSVSASEEEPYFKYGAVHAIKGMTTGAFYEKMAASLYKNFSREITKMLTFTINSKVVAGVKTDAEGNETLVDTTGAVITIASDYADGIIITEVEQEWTLGLTSQYGVNFTVIPTTITYDGDEVKWGTVTTGESVTVIGNGKRIADLEYFCMGERGDHYRNMGWPNVIPTKYLVDPTKTYNILTIQYTCKGHSEDSQGSKKTLILACEDKAELTKLIKQMNSLAVLGIDLEVTE